MAMQFAGPGLGLVNYTAGNYDEICDKTQRHYRRIRGRSVTDQPKDEHRRSHQVPEDMGYELKRRCDLSSDDEVVEVVRHRGEVLPRRPGGPPRRVSSMEDFRSSSRSVRPYNRRQGGDAYDSEGSVPPRSRRRARSAGGKSRARSSSSSSSGTDTSELGSTTDEEKQMKKMKRKKWITAGLATVATVHAVAKIHSSVKAHDKRLEEVITGKISPEEAHKKAQQARWQDAAALGIAALGIKGAYSEWKEVREENHHHQELLEKHEEQHQRRLEHERKCRARSNGGYYKGNDGNWYYNGQQAQYSQRRIEGRSTSDTKSFDQLVREREIHKAVGSRRRPIHDKTFDDLVVERERSKGEKTRVTITNLGADGLEEALGAI